ncbi:MAG: hypothetical protein ACFFB5_06400 [Promethearchaeota archaeon]
MINDTLNYPSIVFNNITFTDEEIHETKSKFRKIFDYNNLNFKEINFENRNYGQLLKLIAYGSRNPRTRKWIDFLINEFTREFHPKYKPSYNLIFTNLTTPYAYVDQESMKRVVSYLRYDKKKYIELDDDEKLEVDYSCLILQEIFSLKETISLIMRSFTSIFDTKAIAKKEVFQYILNAYNYLEKISVVFDTFFGIKIINAYLKDFEYLRHSIAHSHLIITGVERYKGQKYIIQEYLKVNHAQKTFERFGEAPLILFLEMLLITTIFTQILVLYQLLFQDKQIKHGLKEIKPGSIVKLPEEK